MGFAPGAWGAADGVAAGGGGPGTRAEAACGGDPGEPAGCEGATPGGADAVMAAAAATGSGGWSFFPSVRTAATAIAPTRSSKITATSAPRLFGTTTAAARSPLRLMPEAVPTDTACAGFPEGPGVCWSTDAGSAEARNVPSLAARSASANSCAETNRAEGSRAHARWNHVSIAAGSQGALAQRLGSGAVQIWSKRSPNDSLENARLPVSIV